METGEAISFHDHIGGERSKQILIIKNRVNIVHVLFVLTISAAILHLLGLKLMNNYQNYNRNMEKLEDSIHQYSHVFRAT